MKSVSVATSGIRKRETTVVIPTLNASEGLDRLLRSLSAQTVPPAEVIVVDGGSSDSTTEVAKSYSARLVQGKELGQSRNLGGSLASVAYLLFVDADMELPPRLIETCQQTILLCDAICIRESVSAHDLWGRARGFERDAYFGTGIFEAARFMRRSDFLRLGGYDEFKENSSEDIALQIKITRAGLRIGWVPLPIIHHEEELRFSGYIAKRRGRTWTEIKNMYPQEWRAFISPLGRIRRQLSYLLGNFSPGRALSFVCLNVNRLAEFVSRET
jgi:glycosyltransferase involved in cell wall biosynthesis